MDKIHGCSSYLEVQHGVEQILLHGLGHEKVHTAGVNGREGLGIINIKCKNMWYIK